MGRRPPSLILGNMSSILKTMARLTGLEPATSGVTGRHSNRLSYNRARAAGTARPALRDRRGFRSARRERQAVCAPPGLAGRRRKGARLGGGRGGSDGGRRLLGGRSPTPRRRTPPIRWRGFAGASACRRGGSISTATRSARRRRRRWPSSSGRPAGMGGRPDRELEQGRLVRAAERLRRPDRADDRRRAGRGGGDATRRRSTSSRRCTPDLTCGRSGA